MDKNSVIPIKLTGKNYIVWSFHLQHYIRCQGLTEYLNERGTGTVQTNGQKGEVWNQNYSKVVTWILNSVDPSIGLSLYTYTKASEMRKHLKRSITKQTLRVNIILM